MRVSFATNDKRTAKRISDALGTATEMRVMRNYAGHRLSSWLGHLMVSRSEIAQPLLTTCDVIQLQPADEIIMVAGTPPIRAKSPPLRGSPVSGAHPAAACACEVGRRVGRRGRGIIIARGIASIHPFRSSPVFVCQSATIMFQLLPHPNFCLFYSSPIQGRLSAVPHGTGTIWWFLTSNPRRYFAARACCAPLSAPPSQDPRKIRRSSR